jgi:transcriptional regulator with XRE-family HTH domain
MTPGELTRARAVLGLSAERLAVDLHLSEETVVQWEAGKARIPNVYARQIAWRAAVTERQRALAGSGLSECDWVARWKTEPEPRKLEDRLKRLKAFQEHERACAQCLARQRYIDDRFPPLPDPPLSPGLQALHLLSKRLQQLPEWARPAAIGALIGAALVLFRFVFFLVARGPSVSLLTTAGQAAAAAAVSGALGGLAYTRVRRPFSRLGRAGHYLTGVTSLVTAFGAFGSIFSVLGENPKLNGPTDWLLLLGVGAVIGLFVGHGWSKAATDTHSV